MAYNNDRWTTEDDLKFTDFTPALLDIVLNAQTPLTVGVFGPWGSGKTSVLQILKKDIEAKGLTSLRAAWFTAWKYDRHEALWRAFILRVLDALFPRESGDEPREERKIIPKKELTGSQKIQVERLEHLKRALYQAVEWQELGPPLLDLKEAGKELAKLPAFLLFAAARSEEIAKTLGIAPDLAKLVSREARTYRLNQLASMEEFEATFQEAVRVILGKKGRLIIFVDDLDRCLPEKAIEVLEAIKLFLEVEGTVFVLGMDREVIEQGIEARYKDCFRGEGKERAELPIRGDTYLQKIVQVPFYLPPLTVDSVGDYIQTLEKDIPAEDKLTEMTRLVFAHGLFPNPRQVKQALNIFRLVKQVALARQTRKALDEGSVAWPLLAKTVMIQTQWPELYRDWRQYPTLAQTLEAEYARAPLTEEAALRGQPEWRAAKGAEEPEKKQEGQPDEKKAGASAGGLLEPYLKERRKYALLERMLGFPTPEGEEESGERARFAGLNIDQMRVYAQLAGAAGSEQPAVEVAGDLWADLLSGDTAKIADAVARVEEKQKEPVRKQLEGAMRSPAQPAKSRAGAGVALAKLGDARRGVGIAADGLPDILWYRVPAGVFQMGTPKERIPDLIKRYGGEERWYQDEADRHPVDLREFYIARFPVTVAQFQAFVGAGGYGKKIYWPEAAKADVWKGGKVQGIGDSEPRVGPLRLGEPWDLPNHPVVAITWYEALAFCRWLDERWRQGGGGLSLWARGEVKTSKEDAAQWRIMLPSEAEWEKAARGERGGEFPWGDEANPDFANFDKTGIGATSAVGCFPQGASSYGAEEMSGNVWEWTRSLYKEYPYDPKDATREDLSAAKDADRVLRGGSFFYGDLVVRCAYRIRLYPFNYYGYLGFRLVLSPVGL